MKFVTIGKTHYNLENIARFWWFDGVLYAQCVGDTEDNLGQHEDPYRSYYKKLCEITGVLPCEEVSK